MLKLHDISIRRNHRTLIEGLSLEIKKGQFWGIIGRNGTGKTTLLHTMAGLLQPQSGQISVDGHNLLKMDHISRARQINLLMQEQEPAMACTVREAVQMGRFAWPEYQDDGQALLDRCQIAHLADQNILKLSGGERRKVEIATCLAQPSPHWLLDEPMNHLDLVYQQHAIKIFSEHTKIGCVVMIGHDLNIIESHCTHVLMLKGEGCYHASTSATMMTKQHLDQLFNDDHSDQK